jgi:DNA ligase 1
MGNNKNKMRYSNLAKLYSELESTTKRLEKINTLSRFLLTLDKNDSSVLYLLLGNIYPQYDERKIGISNQLAIKALANSTGASKEEVIKEWKKIGDLGKVAEKISSKKKQITLSSKILTTQKILENLRKLPGLEGKGTIGKKLGLITELLTSATPLESLYLIRTLLGDLRIGVQESTVREAIAEAFFKDRNEAAPIVQLAIDKSNDLAEVFEIAQKGKLKALEKISLEIGKPIKAMLANKALTIQEGFKMIGTPAAIEYKYDGFRLIIHKKGKEIKLFTRMLENVTKQFPEIVECIQKYIKGNSFILDSEAVGFDSETKKYQPFQKISQRIRRKYNIEEMQKKLPVEINIFDVLYHDGKSLMEEPFKKRSEFLRKIITNKPYKIIVAKQIITSDEKKAETFYQEALKNNQEGIMMKNLDAPYQPGRRVGNMIKVKPEDRDLDLIITGAEWGTGKRSGTLSSFILSCKNSEGELLEIGKMSTGIKEKAQLNSDGEDEITYEKMTSLLKPLIISEKNKIAKIKPKIVIMVTYQEIQRSPNYKSGFALRFPRFLKLRPDKSINDISSIEEIKNDYEKQKGRWEYG